jgi:separase
MGCSSGNQYSAGEFEPYGTILAYILAGSPAIVFNLKQALLKSWMNLDVVENSNITENDDSSNICMHLIKARNACRLSHLNGSAPVI